MQTLKIISPDDWHCHLRDGAFLQSTVPHAAKQFKRAIIMPNLNPPVTNANEALAYQQRIQACIPQGQDFTPLMVLYLTNQTTSDTLIEAKKSGIVVACKLYPAGVTTHSSKGVTDIEKLYPLFKTMSEQNLILLVHGEVNSPDIDIFDREKVFIERHLEPIVKNFPTLKIVFEHITTKEAVDFVHAQGSQVGATITPHHLMLNRNDLLVGGIKPHYFCLPILKRQQHQEALRLAATSGNPKFFIGTDSAPHAKSQKESACGCAGIYHGMGAISHYAHVFDQMNALDKLEGFTSLFGPRFYGLPVNKTFVTLKKKAWKMPASLAFGNENVIPFQAGETIEWECFNDE